MKDNNWQFDEVFIRKVIEDDLKKIDSCTSLSARRELIEVIDNLDHILNGTHLPSSDDKIVSSDKSLLEIKKGLLLKMQRDFEKVDSKVVEFIMDFSLLNKENLDFFKYRDKYKQPATPDSIVQNSLDIYREYAPEFLAPTLSIVNNPNHLVNFTSNYVVGSRCITDKNSGSIFLQIEESEETPFGFIHELQHGVEAKIGFRPYKYYKELSPIVFETLFIDKMCEKEEKDAELLYNFRLSSLIDSVDYLYSYFNAVKKLSEFNFSPTTSKFYDILCSSKLALKNKRPTYLLNASIDGYIIYLTSFLKSLDIRNEFLDSRTYGLRKLKSILENNEDALNYSALLAHNNYENYAKEVLEKQMIRRKKL